MTMLRRRESYLLANIALVVITNAAILGVAAWNRWGTPRAALELSERELAMPSLKQPESTHLALRLVLGHQRPPFMVFRTWEQHLTPFVRWEDAWLERDDLDELGFDTSVNPSDSAATRFYEARTLPRRTYVVLEMDGEAWQRWLEGREALLAKIRQQVREGKTDRQTLESAAQMMSLNRAMRSRLFPIDAGRDAAVLQQRYSDRERYAVVEGLIQPKVLERAGQAPILIGSLKRLLAQEVQVPLESRGAVEEYLPKWTRLEFFQRHPRGATKLPALKHPRYRATVAIGRRHEPWLLSVRRVQPSEDSSVSDPVSTTHHNSRD